MEREDGQPPRVELMTPVTWFGYLSVKHALIVVNTMILAISIAGTTLMALYMAQRLSFMQLGDLVISASSLALCSCAVGITIFGMYAIWGGYIGMVEAYFWTQPVHWILDLASTIVLLVFAYNKKDAIAQALCTSKKNRQICLETFNARLIMMTIGLCIYKVLGAYAWYLLFYHRKALIATEKESYTLKFLRRTSTSSLSSIFEKKWWSPSQIPIIKIDFASDESSASVYSNDSPGYRTVNFGVQMQYPTLAAPQPAIFASHLGGDASAPGIPSRDPYPDAPPGLPTFSVVGSERGALT